MYEAALNKIRDQATKERLLYGNWDFVEANDMAIYNSFDGSDVYKRQTQATSVTHLDAKEYHLWLQNYTVSELWDKNIIGGRPV